MSVLEAKLERDFAHLSAETRLKVSKFHSLLTQENQIQNLTRLIEPDAFIDGHLIDCIELLKSGYLGPSVLDLGSGAGVPGLLCSILEPDTKDWILIDAEGHKASFLSSVIQELNLNRTTAVHGRVEEFLRTHTVDSVVARAVGPVTRIMGWIGKCSTWNNLILLKSRGWKEEWTAFEDSAQGRKYEISSQHEYCVGLDNKYRVIADIKKRAKPG